MKQEEFQLAVLTLQDHQRLIAAGKVQRWEVLKWAVSVNLALAAAGVATSAPRWALFVFSVLVAGGAITLLLYYDNRITRVKQSADQLTSLLENAYPATKQFVQRYPSGHKEIENYDRKEMERFSQAIFCSSLPCLIVWMASWW